MHHRVPLLVTSLALAVALLLGLAAYFPGLRGGFLFDDFGNLPILGSTGPIVHWPAFWRYITSGTADPTGRPLTLLTFLIDAHDWPADPFPFKRTNLALHLVNGLLLYRLLSTLGKLLNVTTSRARVAAVFGCAAWLLHPLLASTVLYVVQREAMLSTTFVIGGLMLWLHGRGQIVAGRVTRGASWSIVALAGFGLLGVLAKANGILLPLFALLIETLVLAERQPVPVGKARKLYRVIVFWLAAVPAACVTTYLIWLALKGLYLGNLAPFRSWTVGQRLLTEPRVLFDYLKLLWLPRPFSNGLFNDQFVASSSWLQPWSTIPAALLLIGSALLACKFRQQHPAAALAWLFFLCGQLIESTSIPLELYFEHRNYMAALLMFWPLGLWLANPRSPTTLKRIVICVIPLSLAAMTYISASVWGDQAAQARIWATLNPNSPRAQAYAAQLEIRSGEPLVAEQSLAQLLALHPEQAQLAFNLIDARCMAGGVTRSDIAAADLAMRHTLNPGTLLAHWFEHAVTIADSTSCNGLTLEDIATLVDAGQTNINLGGSGPQQDLQYIQALIALKQHDPTRASRQFTRALDIQVRPAMALEAAATLGQSGYPALGLSLLDHYERVQSTEDPPPFGMPMLHSWVLQRQQYWPKEIYHLRQVLALDVATDKANTRSPDSDKGS